MCCHVPKPVVSHMAKTSTSPNQVSPADLRAAFLESSKPRLNGLRLVQERARMTLSKARMALLATPKDHPERAFRSNQFRLARQAHEAAKLALIQAQTAVDIQADSLGQSDAEPESLSEWAKECAKAQAPFEFVVNRKGGRLRPAKGTVRAACGQVCMNEVSKIDHEAGCPECQSKLSAKKARESLILEI